MKATLIWALWIASGGSVNGGYLRQPSIAAYFQSEKECVRVLELVHPQTRWAQCIQAEYVK